MEKQDFPNTKPQVAILGTVGLPARYGGFETLAEAIVSQAEAAGLSDRISVTCSAPQSAPDRPEIYRGARLRYLPLKANGAQSVPYDMLSLLQEVWRGTPVILLMGVSGALALPLIRLLSRAKLVVHVDGIEWRRAKWTGLAKAVLRRSERAAARWAHVVIADNEGIGTHITQEYGRDAHIIAYGGEQAVATSAGDISDLGLPDRYSLAMARVEPENNLEMILDAFARYEDRPLVVMGNWDASPYGQDLRTRFADYTHIRLLDAEYDPARLRAIRDRAWVFLHGHSAGGTNPVLVEMMHFGIPIAAFDCVFNRATTEDRAAFFSDASGLSSLLPHLATSDMGAGLKEIAERRYLWSDVARAYFELLDLPIDPSPDAPEPL